MKVKISRDNYNKILEHAKKEFPNECCGLIAGVKAEGTVIINEIYELANIDNSSEHFSMDPKEQFKAIKDIRSKGYELLGNYHSHPFTPSRPSEEDKRLAFDPEAIYAIISIQESIEVLNLFSIKSNKEVAKLDYEII